jgi:hypothetical protein
LDQLKITQEPGLLGILEFVISGLDDNGIEKRFVKVPETQIIYSRKCIAGEAQKPDGTCK